MPAEELFFEPTPAFGPYKPFLQHAVAHPAKMNTNLLEFLIRNFTKLGDTILDPMSGSGSTGVVAALFGRNAVQVELEEKFWEWMEKARENVEKHPTNMRKGWIKNILGDARRLSQLLQEADVVITSPPYSESMTKKRKGYTIIPQLAGTRHMGEYTKNENLANLPHGNVDAIITSPPFGDTYVGGGDPKKRLERLVKAGCNPKDFLGGKARNAVLKHYHEIDVILTSPPFGEANRGGGIAEKGYNGKYGKDEKLHLRHDRPLSDSPKNISNLPFIDVIVTSPPYEGSLEGTSRHTKGGIASRDPALAQTGTYATLVDTVITSPPYECQLHDSREKRAAGAWNGSELDVEKNLPMGYSENPKNIGNMKKETYLSEMLKVYNEMACVLKPAGLAIIVVKPFVRNKKVVDLPLYSWFLLDHAGFKLAKLYKLRLKQESFWRILFYKKYSNVPRIRHEYVLICRKPDAHNVTVDPGMDPLEFLAETIKRQNIMEMLKKLA